MSKNITTKVTIQNLAAQIKKDFVKKSAFTPVQQAATAAFKSGKVDGNTVSLYTSTDQTATPRSLSTSRLSISSTRQERLRSDLRLEARPPTPAPPTPTWRQCPLWCWLSRATTTPFSTPSLT